MSLHIREAVAADLMMVVSMAARFIEESEYADKIASSAPDVEAFALRLMEGEDAALFVAERDGAIIGMIGLWVFRHPFSGERVASELAWWVEPEHRQSSAGRRLLSAAEAWASGRGAVSLHMIAPNAHVEQFYQRVGYSKVEVTYERRLT